jgi:O-antigen/teichoic acid export membrane protein
MKLSRIKELTKDAAIYGFGSVAVKIVGFLLIPVYTHYLSPADYGVLALITMYTSLFAVIIGLGQHQAVFRYYFKYDETDPRRPAVIRTFLALAFAMAIPVRWRCWPPAPSPGCCWKARPWGRSWPWA